MLQAVKTKTDGPVFLIDIIQDRLDLAKRIYPDVHIINAMEIDPIAAIKGASPNGNGVDVAFEVAGHDASGGKVINPVRGCINIIRGAGKVVVLGLGDEPAPVVFKELIWKEAQIIASRVTHGEFAEVIDQMAQGKLHPEALITKTLAMSEANVAFGMLDQAPGEHLKVLLELAT